MALIPSFLSELVEFKGFIRIENLGDAGTRLTAPFPVGCKVRLKILTIKEIEYKEKLRGSIVTLAAVLEVEGTERPVCTHYPKYLFLH